jgi:hypothetical protein
MGEIRNRYKISVAKREEAILPGRQWRNVKTALKGI